MYCNNLFVNTISEISQRARRRREVTFHLPPLAAFSLSYRSFFDRRWLFYGARHTSVAPARQCTLGLFQALFSSVPPLFTLWCTLFVFRCFLFGLVRLRKPTKKRNTVNTRTEGEKLALLTPPFSPPPFPPQSGICRVIEKKVKMCIKARGWISQFKWMPPPHPHQHHHPPKPPSPV